MIEKIKRLKERFNELKLIVSDSKYSYDININKEYKNLSNILSSYKDYEKIINDINETKVVLSQDIDSEFKSFAKKEIFDLNLKSELIEKKIKLMISPKRKDPNDNKNAILEIRSGSGGSEASIFVGDLFRMYRRFSEKKK